MDAPDLLGSGQVGDCARHAKDAVKAASGETHGPRGVGEEFASRLVGGRDPIQQFAIGLRIGTRAVSIVAVGLELPRHRHAPRERLRSKS